MNDQELLRYSKQVMLPQIEIEGQQKIMDSTMLIIGMGGLGSPTALYLAASGVGHIIIAEDLIALPDQSQRLLYGQRLKLPNTMLLVIPNHPYR
jgi:adenylyltransferase/sulfurtransferase